MTVDETIKELQKLSEEGFGDYEVKTYECSRYHAVNFCVAEHDQEYFFVEVY